MQQTKGEQYSHYKWLEYICRKKGTDLKIDVEHDDVSTAWVKAQKALGINEQQLKKDIAEKFELEIALLPESVASDLLEFVPLSVAKRYLVFPLKTLSNRIVVAAAHPDDQELISMLGFLTAHVIEVQVASPREISEWIDQYYDDEKNLDEQVIIKSNKKEKE